MELKFVICGLEHSGTTLVSDLFRQIEEVDSGFECGVLLGDSPRDFHKIQPFYNNICAGWEVDEQALERACTSDSYIDFYQSLYQSSGFQDPKVKYLFDKTPRYFQKLFECQEKAGVPFIATFKDPRSVVYSDFKRTGQGKAFEEWYETYKAPKLQYLSKIYQNSYLRWKLNRDEVGSTIMCVAIEDICLSARETVEQMFSFVGFDFEIGYLLMKNLRYSHTRVPEISSRIPFEYLEKFETEQIKKIEDDFQSLSDWFYH